MALNAPIQGPAADVTEVAMLRAVLSVAGLRPRLLLQVHDKLTFEMARGELSSLEKLVKTGMDPPGTARSAGSVQATSRGWVEADTDPEAVAPCQATSTEAVRPRRANSLMIRNC